MHEEVIRQERWIIEGYIDEKMTDRVRVADLVLYLDYSGLRCAWRVFKRWFSHRKESRPELPREALEELGTKFLWMVLNRKERKDIENSLRHVNRSKIVRFTSPHQLERFMRGVTNKF
jgi:adenylate kinase family enzyme